MNNTYDDVCYVNTFLKRVVLKLDFEDQEMTFLNDESLSKIQQIYTKYEKTQVKIVNTKIGIASDTAVAELVSCRHVFSSQSIKPILTIGEAERSIWIETAYYDTWDAFKDSVVKIFNAIAAQFKNANASRVGLRYINQIPLNNINDTRRYFVKKIREPFVLSAMEDDISRFFIIKEYNKGEFYIRMQYGIPNQHYPARIVAQDFILDIDVYTQQAANFSLILDKIEIYHDHVQSIFEESITQTLRSLMGARDNNAE